MQALRYSGKSMSDTDEMTIENTMRVSRQEVEHFSDRGPQNGRHAGLGVSYASGGGPAIYFDDL